MQEELSVLFPDGQNDHHHQRDARRHHRAGLGAVQKPAQHADPYGMPQAGLTQVFKRAVHQGIEQGINDGFTEHILAQDEIRQQHDQRRDPQRLLFLAAQGAAQGVDGEHGQGHEEDIPELDHPVVIHAVNGGEDQRVNDVIVQRRLAAEQKRPFRGDGAARAVIQKFVDGHRGEIAGAQGENESDQHAPEINCQQRPYHVQFFPAVILPHGFLLHGKRPFRGGCVWASAVTR